MNELRTQNIRLHAILDVDIAAAGGWKPAELARAFLDGGTPLIQIRAKRMPSAAFLGLCDEIVQAAEPYHTTVIVNDRVDLAALSHAAGVHVGQDDVPPAAARGLLGGHAIIGYSTHTPDQIEAAVREPLSYLAIGPVFGSRTKATGYEALGLESVTDAVRRSAGTPVVAIGGITLETAPRVIEAGAAGVAVIADLLTERDPTARVRRFVAVLEQF